MRYLRMMGDNLELIDTLLECQKRAIRWQLALAGLLIVVGLLVFVVGILSAPLGTGISKNIVALLGACASTVSAFPLKDLVVRREKADALRLLKVRLKALESQSDSAEAEKITTMLWDSLKTIIEK